MTSEAQIAEILGIRGRAGDATSLLLLADEVNKGLPLSALNRVVSQVAPFDNTFIYRFVPKSTLARRLAHQKRSASRRKQARLSAVQGAKVARLAEVWAFAKEVWGSDEQARDFLFRPHPLLEGRRPIDVVLANEFGRPLVDGILGRLQYGSAA
ncbi:MAG TPA: antitoxin Xre/MbcA/ParS toxin-binding domain-containing protein [Acetobacteraceae bacterium]|nr:antitoxin Xre/MbcA/ParS toxin-binding domain-containing protein [Acetobacteraceae bacterium]